MKKIYVAIFVTALLLSLIQAHPVSAQLVTCTDISGNLSLGSSDAATTDKPVIALQNYLVYLSFLYETPNGYFDDQTANALKQFQTANNIAATGALDAATAAKIKLLTCPAASAATVSTPVQSAPVSSLVVSPKNGDNLNIGTSYPITWNEQAGSSYDILLVGVDTNDGGYIASNLTGQGTFLWRAGDVTTVSNPLHHLVAPATYRIDIRSYNAGSPVSDNYSGTIKLSASSLSISSVLPSSAAADGLTSIVLYGSGFGSQNIVYFDSTPSLSASPAYTSPDGRVLVFTIPSGITSGQHALQVGQSSSNLSVSSNQVTLSITSSVSTPSPASSSSVPPATTPSSNSSDTTTTIACPAGYTCAAAPTSTVTTPTPPATAGASSSTSYTFSRYLYMGMTAYAVSDPDVYALQQRLKADGVYSGPVTGYFGAQTKTGVMAYQKKHGLDPLGVVGPSTRNLLNKGI